jgi:curved DNA-binding protein CbpA
VKNPYQILELPPNASPRRIKDQYRKLAKIYHPDRFNDPADKARSAEKFKEITDAYEALSGVVRRGNLTPRERKLDFLYEQGKGFFEQNKWSKAIAVFSEILTLEANYRDTLTWLREARRKHKGLATLYNEAETLFQRRQWAEAIQRFQQILQQDPDYRDAAKRLKAARREQLKETFMIQN